MDEFNRLLERVEELSAELALEKRARVDAEHRADIGPAKVSLTTLFDAIAERRKIEAIKEYRLLTGAGLLESKTEVERIYDRIHYPNHAAA